MLDDTSCNLRALRDKCELHYQIPALWSIPPTTRPWQWTLCEQGVPNNRCQQHKQTPAPSSIWSLQGMTDKLQRAVSHPNPCELLYQHVSKWHLFPFYAKATQVNLWPFEIFHTWILTNNLRDKEISMSMIRGGVVVKMAPNLLWLPITTPKNENI